MPLITETAPSPKHRRQAWKFIPAVLSPILIGLLIYAWFQPIHLTHPMGTLQIGYFPAVQQGGWFYMSNSGWGWAGVKFPKPTPGIYGFAWGWRGWN